MESIFLWLKNELSAVSQFGTIIFISKCKKLLWSSVGFIKLKLRGTQNNSK